MPQKGFSFAIDRGGTFTDIWAKSPSGKIYVSKLLSEDDKHYSDAPSEGIRRILAMENVQDFLIDGIIDGNNIEWIRMGTTVATNALLEKKGESIAVFITKGLKDLFIIGDQSRRDLFNLKIDEQCTLYEEIVEVDERILLKHPDCLLTNSFSEVITKTGDKIIIYKSLNLDEVKSSLRQILAKGIKNLAVVLLHSYLYDEHEKMIEKLALEMGFESVDLSSRSSSMIKIVPRGSNTCIDSYLNPILKKYISGFLNGFKNLPEKKVLMMQSNGGMTSVEKFIGSRAIMSGPSGGVVALTTFNEINKLPLIGFDMGGTSTDVSRYSGYFEEAVESSVAGVKLLTPHLDIQTVAAGGGSKLSFHCGIFYVGPESAGANPGPTCYRNGGPLTITDANLVLGRVLPEYFPKVFGASRNLPLDKESSYKKFELLTKEINDFNVENSGKIMTVEEVALGFINVANETMCRPIRALTEAKGYDTSQHVLCCFGGAGGQHACSIAKSLNIQKVYVHKYSGILSAFGISLADVTSEKQEPSSTIFESVNYEAIERRVNDLKAACIGELTSKGFKTDSIQIEIFFHMRYDGTDFAIICSGGKQKNHDSKIDFHHFDKTFNDKFKQEFGFNLNKKVFIETMRVKGYGMSDVDFIIPPPLHSQNLKPVMVANVFFDGKFEKTPVYEFDEISVGRDIYGPSIVISGNSTIIIEPDCSACLTSTGDLEIKVNSKKKEKLELEFDSAQISVFSHRYMGIAEQMGRVLQRTALSVNIKERLDFSCALFGPDGGLVANAPHIPVHLGAMQKAVKYQIESIGDKMKPGDVILSNHPCAGGSHLPDLTVITPVFHEGLLKPVFYVACRGHHADVGGITPGSMPSSSKTIYEEGASFKSFFLVKDGHFNEAELIKALEEPAKHPNCSGSRNIKDNICDLQAQIAANKKGILLVQGLIAEFGLDFVVAYMKHIQFVAERAVRQMLKTIHEKYGKDDKTVLVGEDWLDEGYKIRLTVTISQEGSAIFDFSGSSFEVYGNLNTPEAVTYSAIIYCLRCMIQQDIPLNQGCLKPIKIIIPKGSILSPSDNAAVVAGNVLTSQRIVDVIFKTFEVCAASQGCMNNITFGDDTFGYYETVGGGSGAGPLWHGRSGVHTHMTNTKITDIEVLEKRFPVLVSQFAVNRGSGGMGKFCGGNGIIREFQFRKPLIMSVLSERRVFQPYGMNGGCPGQCGLNILKRDGRNINLGAKCTLSIMAGDIFCLMTPGGGGYGAIQ